jgi:general nucleoside transport system permease protein
MKRQQGPNEGNTSNRGRMSGGRTFGGLLSRPHVKPILVSVLAVLMSFVVIALFLLVLGKNPLEAMGSFLCGCGFLPKTSYAEGKGMPTDFMSFLDILAPMMLASLGVIVALKAGLFNIGISGQMLAAGFVATILVGYSGLDAYIARPLVILVGIVVGGLFGGFVGYLKYAFNIHEVVSTIMFNYIVSYVTGFFVNSFFVDTISRSSVVVKDAARLTIYDVPFLGYKASFPIGIVIALAAVFCVRFFLDRMVVGFEIRAVGFNRKCAQYAGMHVGRNMVLAMAMSGMLAGLAGVTYYLGYYNTIIPKQLPSMGYDSIAVALLGNTSPVGSIFASILITIFQKGNVYMSSRIGVAREIASVITGILLLFSACNVYMWDAFARLFSRIFGRRAAAESTDREEKEGRV